MSDPRNPLLTGLAIATTGLAVIAGSAVRDRVDLGVGQSQEGSWRKLVASTDVSSVPEDDYFYEMSRLLKREYVEPIVDDQKLAAGAVRGMVASLGDPHSLFMDREEFQAFLGRRQGVFEGIGVDLSLRLPSKAVTAAFNLAEDGADSEDVLSAFPRLVVSYVVPGGPADKAGVKLGDSVYEIDRHWVFDSELLLRFREAQRKADARQITFADLARMRDELREKLERNLLPLRAKERLVVGKSGTVNVVWVREGQKRSTTLERSVIRAAEFGVRGREIRLPFVANSAEQLRKAIAGKSEVRIDLTGNLNGDFSEMRKCLEVLAPPGRYGYLADDRKSPPSPLAVKTGNAKPPKITLRVDRTTGGAAEIFALALSGRNLAKLEGSAMEGSRVVQEIVQLADGSGFTLQTGRFLTKLPVKPAAPAARKTR